MPDRVPEGAHRLPRQDAPRGVSNGAADDHGQALAGLLHQFVQCEQRRLGVEGVEDGFHQEEIAAAFQQGLRLLAVGRAQFVKADVACAGVVHVGADAGRARRGAQRAGHEARPVRRAVAVAGLARKMRCGHVHLVGQVGQAVVLLRDGGGAEGVGLHHVGAGGQVLLMDALNDIGPCQHQQVVVAFEVLRVVGQARAAEIRLGELFPLDHGAHRAVQDDDALLENAGQSYRAGVGDPLNVHAVDCRNRPIPR